MSSIALIHSGKSFMPEIAAYQTYFQHQGIKASILISPSQQEMEPYDILWFFMGIQYYLNEFNKNKFVVHEYCSASTPPLAGLKDLIKRKINAKPNLRISLATEHRGVAFPADDIPVIFRQQGIHSCFFEHLIHNKEFDFVYSGSAMKIRNTGKWLSEFSSRFPDKKILLIGNHEAGIIKQFKSNPNIHFDKPVPVTTLPGLLAKARYAVNYVPDVYPFNIQPSTKLLEYCAAGCQIISNRYQWVTKFDQQKSAGIFFLTYESFDNLSDENLDKFEFTTPGISEYRWENIFEKMQLQKFLPI